MKRWGLLLGLAVVLIAAGATLKIWAPLLLHSVERKTDLIQGLEAGVQLVLIAGGGIILLLKLLRPKKKPPEPTAPQTKVEKRAVTIGGDARNNIIVAGDDNEVVQAKTYIKKQVIHGQSTADPTVLRAAYLNRLFESSRPLSLAGIDLKAASEAEARLNLETVYTALLTQTPEMHERLQRGELFEKEKPEKKAHRRLGSMARCCRCASSCATLRRGDCRRLVNAPRPSTCGALSKQN
jgi:hypothetical protein